MEAEWEDGVVVGHEDIDDNQSDSEQVPPLEPVGTAQQKMDRLFTFDELGFSHVNKPRARSVESKRFAASYQSSREIETQDESDSDDDSVPELVQSLDDLAGNTKTVTQTFLVIFNDGKAVLQFSTRQDAITWCEKKLKDEGLLVDARYHVYQASVPSQNLLELIATVTSASTFFHSHEDQPSPTSAPLPALIPLPIYLVLCTSKEGKSISEIDQRVRWFRSFEEAVSWVQKQLVRVDLDDKFRLYEAWSGEPLMRLSSWTKKPPSLSVSVSVSDPKLLQVKEETASFKVPLPLTCAVAKNVQADSSLSLPPSAVQEHKRQSFGLEEQVGELFHCLYGQVDWSEARVLLQGHDELRRLYDPFLKAEQGDYRDWHLTRMWKDQKLDFDDLVRQLDARVNRFPLFIAAVHQRVMHGPSFPSTVAHKEIVHRLVMELLGAATHFVDFDHYAGSVLGSNAKTARGLDDPVANAQMWLGWCYVEGFGVPKDFKRAFELLSLAASTGHARARYWLAKYLYGNSHLSVANKELDIKFTRASADAGFPPAQSRLAYLSDDLGVTLKWHRRASLQDYTLAFYNLSMVDNVASNEVRIRWLETAAERGFPTAMFKLGQLYSTGREEDQQVEPDQKAEEMAKPLTVVLDRKRALFWFKSLLSSSASIRAALRSKTTDPANGMGMDVTTQTHYLLALAYREGWSDADMSLNIAGAQYHFEQAAISGHADSQYELAQLLFASARTVLNGRLNENDAVVKVAFEWCTKAALKNHLEAQLHLAAANNTGEGVPFDPVGSLRWYQMAAMNGDGLAKCKVALAMENGWCAELGLEQDKNERKAIELYKQAVALGHKLAKGRLLKMLADGRDGGVFRELMRTIEYHSAAAELSNAESQTKLVDAHRALADYWSTRRGEPCALPLTPLAFVKA